MPSWYFKEDATGAGTGANPANGFTTFAAVNAVLAAGDTVNLCKRDDGGGCSQTWTMTVTGTSYSVPITIVGCDSAGTPLGTGAVIGNPTYFNVNGASVRANGFVTGAMEWLIIKNVRWHNHTGDGLSVTANADFCALIDCASDNNGGNGVSTTPRSWTFIRFKASGNSGIAINNPSACDIVNSYFVNNTTSGIGGNVSNCRVTGCLFSGGQYGIDLGNGNTSTLFSCFVYGSSVAGVRNSGVSHVVTGFLFHSCAKNYVDTAAADTAIWSRHQSYNAGGANTVSGALVIDVATVTLGSDPCVNAAGGNFTLTASTTARNVRTYFDALNSSYNAPGALEPEELPAGGARGILTGGRL